jgi:hypothetical protein
MKNLENSTSDSCWPSLLKRLQNNGELYLEREVDMKYDLCCHLRPCTIPIIVDPVWASACIKMHRTGVIMAGVKSRIERIGRGLDDRSLQKLII